MATNSAKAGRKTDGAKKKRSITATANYRKQRVTFKSAADAWWIINQRLPNPDIVLRRKSASITLYRELLADSHLGAVLESRESATLAYDWRIERGKCPVRLYSAIERWFFSIIERKMCVEDLSRDEVTANLLDVIYWGFQPAELTWDYVYGLWLPVQITPKPPEWFHFFINEDGHPELRFLSKTEPINGEAPPDEFTLICPRIKPSYINPYGRGVAQRCFWPIVFKRAGMEFWLNFLERFGMPWVKGTIEGAADQTAIDSYLTDLKTLVQDAVIVVSGGKELEILEGKSSGQRSASGFREICDFMDSQVTKTVLGHVLSTDAGDKASYAATRGAMTVRDDIQKRDMTMIRSVYNDIINLIFIRNGFMSAERPKAVAYHADIIETDRATRDEALSRAGLRFKKSYFIRAYHIEDDDIDVVDPDALQATGLPGNETKPSNVVDIKKEKTGQAGK